MAAAAGREGSRWAPGLRLGEEILGTRDFTAKQRPGKFWGGGDFTAKRYWCLASIWEERFWEVGFPCKAMLGF